MDERLDRAIPLIARGIGAKWWTSAVRAFLFERSIDIDTYDRHAEKLRKELTLVRLDRHSGQLEELDVEGILAFAERVLPRAADLWVQASLEQRQRFQQLFFPDGIAFDGNCFVGTGVTAPAFSYLREIRTGNEGLVGQTGIEPLTYTDGPVVENRPRQSESLSVACLLRFSDCLAGSK